MNRAQELLQKLEDIEVEEASMKTITRVRAGKRQRIRRLDCPPGKKAVGGKCVKISGKEHRLRSKASKRTSKTLKSNRKSMNRKRARSMKKVR